MWSTPSLSLRDTKLNVCLPARRMVARRLHVQHAAAARDSGPARHRRRADPTLDAFLGQREEPFFVKNLENVQVDQRDVIFLSVTYARSPDGKLRQNFGPLNGENGWRRLNVITTRARRRMRVFSSMPGDEISVAGAGLWRAASTRVSPVR